MSYANIDQMSNAARVRMLIQVLNYLALKYGDHGEIVIPLDALKGKHVLGLLSEDGLLKIVADADFKSSAHVDV